MITTDDLSHRMFYSLQGLNTTTELPGTTPAVLVDSTYTCTAPPLPKRLENPPKSVAEISVKSINFEKM